MHLRVIYPLEMHSKLYSTFKVNIFERLREINLKKVIKHNKRGIILQNIALELSALFIYCIT
jgi:hypothetical protein